MVVDFGMASTTDSAGYFAGWITGMFMIGRVMSSIPWGILADRWGRKPCLLISMLNVAVFGVLFGFSSNFVMAMVSRLCIGIGNGFMAVAKTVISEIVANKDQELKAFGILNGTWGIGMIVGPVVGGLLSRPAVLYPQVFASSSLWGRFPYLLPCLCCAAVAVAAEILIFRFVPETLTSSTSLQDSVEEGDTVACREGTGMDSEIEMTATDGVGEFRLIAASEEEADGIPYRGDGEPAEEAHAVMECHSYSKLVSSEDQGRKKAVWQGLKELLLDPKLQLLFCVYSSTCFVVLMVDETFPLWCVSNLEYGGLSWESSEVGSVLGAIGGCLVVFQLTAYSYVMKTCFDTSPPSQYFRLLCISSVGMAVVPLAAAGVSYLSPYTTASQARSSRLLFVAVVLAEITFRVPASCAFTTLGIIVNSSVDKSLRGTLNGLIMTAGSIGNAAGPIVGSMLYASLMDIAKSRHVAKGVDGRWMFGIASVFTLSLAYFAKYKLSG